MPRGISSPMNKPQIETACLTDLENLLGIEQSSFGYDVITRRQMRYLLGSKTAVVVKAVLRGTTIGYMVMLSRRNSSIVRIYSLAVTAEERRLGFGRIMLEHAEEYCRENGFECIHLELHAKNRSGLVFYLATGYCLYGRKENYYTDGGAVLLLRKYISLEEAA